MSRRLSGAVDQSSAFLVVALAVVFVWLPACESDQSVCGSNDECPGDQVCQSGVCQLPDLTPCDNSADCRPQKICIDDRCRDPDGLDASLSDIAPPPDSGPDTSDTQEPDTRDPDETPPEFDSLDPPAGSTGVPTDKTIVVTFSEEIREPAISTANFSLRGPANQDVAISLTKQSPTEIAIDPDTSLYPASPYTVELGEDIRDMAGNPLGETLEFTFSTAANRLARHRQIAKSWAPIIHQGLHKPNGDGPRTDIPTRVNFDGDRDASNNETNARDGNDLPKAHVYYQVTESRSHTFIQYILYYATYSDDKGSTHTEHHFAGATFTIERATGTLLSVDGIDLNPGGFQWVGFYPESADLGSMGSTLARQELNSSKWSLIEGSHYPMYIKGGTHETCHWRSTGVSTGLGNVCAHNSESFVAETGVILEPGSNAETYAQAEPPQGSPNGIERMNYRLVSLSAELWPFRRPFGTDELFSSGYTYTPSPSGGSRPVGFDGTEHVLPTEMSSQDTDSFGQSPFRWPSFSTAGVEGRGQWLLDPAHIADTRYDFSSRSVSLSKDYCYNAFFNIDMRQSMGCPPAPTGDTGVPDGGLDAGADGS